MHIDPRTEAESKATPMLLAGGAILFIAILVLVSGGEHAERAKADLDPTSAGSGRGGAVSLVPGAPVGVGAGGSPVPDAPPMTIIEDIRETLHRLPLDRNNPEKYDPPPRPKPR